MAKERLVFNQLEAGVGIEPAYTDLQSAAWPLCHPAMILNQKGKRSGPLSTKLGAGNESRTRDLNLGKANAAPNHTATRSDVTSNCRRIERRHAWRVLVLPLDCPLAVGGVHERTKMEGTGRRRVR